MATVERDDIQGIVTAGYGHLPSASFVLLRFEADGTGRAPNANAWLSRIVGSVTGGAGRPDVHALQLALTHGGLSKLGVTKETAGGFAPEFVAGMAEPNRSRALGDTGASAPERWAWGGPTTPSVDVLLLLYARDDAVLEQRYGELAAGFAAGQVVELKRLTAGQLSPRESFGFADGISQPIIDGLGGEGPDADRVAAGEFLLGYPNAYGQYPGSPVVTDAEDRQGVLSRARGGGRDLGRNGSYLVYRELGQNVDGFLAFLDEATRKSDGTSDPDAALRLASKIVGRWPSGAPLVLAPDADDPSLARANEFGYFHQDRLGDRCPIGSHIRRSNPRDSLPPRPGSDQSVEVGKRHRILRRGRQRALDDTGPTLASGHGLHFLCLNANLARQFEFIQGTWCDNPKFGGLYGDRDPLVTTAADQTFRLPGSPVRTRYTGLPNFITVLGGGYFFLPGLRALRYLGGLRP